MELVATTGSSRHNGQLYNTQVLTEVTSKLSVSLKIQWVFCLNFWAVASLKIHSTWITSNSVDIRKLIEAIIAVSLTTLCCMRLNLYSLISRILTNATLVINQKKVNNSTTTYRNIVLRITSAILTNSTGVQAHTYEVFDETSTVTLLDEEISNIMGLQADTRPLSLHWPTYLSNHTSNSNIVSLENAGVAKGSKTFILYNVRTVENLSVPTQNLDVSRKNLLLG